MRTSRNFDKEDDNALRQSTILNKSISENPHVPRLLSDRSIKNLSKGRYSSIEADDKWLQ